MMTKDLEIIGITGRDKRVYEAMLELPRASVRAIADRTGINRGSVYESIKQLMSVGMVTKIDSSARPVYMANDPDILHELVNERRRQLHALHETINDYSANLRRAGASDTPRFVSFYDGDEGVATILRDVLAICRGANVTSYEVISSPRVSRYLYNNFPHYTRERQRLGIYPRVLRQGPPVRAGGDDAIEKYIHPAHDTGCYTLIYGEKLALVTIGDYNFIQGVIIENPAVVQIYRMLFEASWRQADDS